MLHKRLSHPDYDIPVEWIKGFRCVSHAQHWKYMDLDAKLQFIEEVETKHDEIERMKESPVEPVEQRQREFQRKLQDARMQADRDQKEAPTIPEIAPENLASSSPPSSDSEQSASSINPRGARATRLLQRFRTMCYKRCTALSLALEKNKNADADAPIDDVTSAVCIHKTVQSLTGTNLFFVSMMVKACCRSGSRLPRHAFCVAFVVNWTVRRGMPSRWNHRIASMLL